MRVTRSLVLAATTVAVLIEGPAAVARAEVETPPAQALATGAIASVVAVPWSVAVGVLGPTTSGGSRARIVDPTPTQMPSTAWTLAAPPIDGSYVAPAVAPADEPGSSFAWLGGALVLGLLTAGVIVLLRKRR